MVGSSAHPRWHDGAIDDLIFDGRPIVWSVATTGPVADHALASAPANADDLADAARSPFGAERLLRHRLARALIARLADVRAETVRLSHTPHGVPIFDTPAGWHLGLSGRDGACLIGVARRPIAVDREPFDDAPPLWDMLTPSEIAALERLPETERPQAWLRRWTIKEAHAKLVGEPLRIPAEAIDTRLIDETRATADFEGQSHCWTRSTPTALETVATWA